MTNHEIQSMCQILLSDIEKVRHCNSIKVIGIDGPTAAGKTIFADALSQVISRRLENSVFIYRLDWALRDRKERMKDLEAIKELGDPFTLEAELHMHLHKLEFFLSRVCEFNKESQNNFNQHKVFNIELENLYSRQDEGRLSETARVCLKPGDIVIVEGHYSLRSELNKFFDVNVLMLSNQNTLLERKINRVAGYRDEEKAKQYFHLIDVPSFDHHIKRFGHNATHIIQNDDFEKPELVDKEALNDWCGQSSNYKSLNKPESEKKFGTSGIVQYLFQSSDLAPKGIKLGCESIFSIVNDLDKVIAEKVVKSVDEQKDGLANILNDLVDAANAESMKKDSEYNLKVKFSSNLHNVHFRKFPVSFGITISNQKFFTVLFDVYEDRLDACIVWQGGILSLVCLRELGGEPEKDDLIWGKKPHQNKQKKCAADLVTLLSPTNFMVPTFLMDGTTRGYQKFVKTNNRVSLLKSLEELSQGQFCLIARFDLQAETLLFSNLCTLVGADTVCIGKYLISLKTDNKPTQLKFKLFKTSWLGSQENGNETFADIAAHDEQAIKEIKSLSTEVDSSLRGLKEIDGHLFLDVNKIDIKVINKSLRTALGSQNRLLRKRAFEFIIRTFGDLELETKRIWPDVSGTPKTISISDLCKFQPSIMGEIYLWQSIVESRTAILGANVYDISHSSLDSQGHLLAASKEGVPVVLQGSLNALGESFNGGKQGYLRSPNGAKSLVDAVLQATRELYLAKGVVPPLFGIGLDHVDARNDNPSGRAKNFLSEALSTRLVTHIVLDGSSLFNAKNETKESLKSAYGLVADYAGFLVEGMESSLMVDKEICSGELNYIGDTKEANVPTVEEIRFFVDALMQSFRKYGLRCFLRRPMLLIGNVGTTHHAKDGADVKAEVSKEWIDEVKSNMFVSAVLHGTTGSDADVLRKALSGCKKINIAGDFLATYLNALPETIREKIFNISKHEPKYGLSDIRSNVLDLDEDQRKYVTDKIAQHTSRVLKTINSPKLTDEDISFFRYVPYVFNDLELDEIFRKLSLSVTSDIKSNANLKYDSKNEIRFCPSLIEVEYGDQFINYTREFLDNNIKTFHVDVGDGKFISREFSGLDKTREIKRLDPSVNINVHMMVRDPHLTLENNDSKSSINLIAAYAVAGCTKIGIHQRAFSSPQQMKDCLSEIRQQGCEPGIVLELDEDFSTTVAKLLITEKLGWVVVMGVPIGYGGQLFSVNSLDKISRIRRFSLENNLNLDIEIDGGLNLDNIGLCLRAGANFFSGWSIVKPDSDFKISEKLDLVFESLAN